MNASGPSHISDFVCNFDYPLTFRQFITPLLSPKGLEQYEKTFIPFDAKIKQFKHLYLQDLPNSLHRCNWDPAGIEHYLSRESILKQIDHKQKLNVLSPLLDHETIYFDIFSERYVKRFEELINHHYSAYRHVGISLNKESYLLDAYRLACCLYAEKKVWSTLK